MGRAEDDLINSITLWFLLAFLLFLFLFFAEGGKVVDTRSNNVTKIEKQYEGD